MGCGARCADNFKWSLRGPQRPPKGGWSIRTLPPSITDQRIIWSWENRTNNRKCHNANDAVNEVMDYLRVNGIEDLVVDGKSLRRQVQYSADAEYCARQPERCRQKAETTSDPVAMSTADTSMAWARRFWETVNIMLASDYQDHVGLVTQWTAMADTLLRSNVGCDKCLEHFTTLLSLAPPATVIKSMEHARVWTWRVHNASRQGKAPVSFWEVATTWKWPEISADRIQELLIEMNMVELP